MRYYTIRSGLLSLCLNLPSSLKWNDVVVTKGLLVEQGVSHLRDGQQRTPGVRFGICGTVEAIPTAAAAADDPTTWWWWRWCGGWYKTLLLLVLLSALMPMPMPIPTPIPVVPTADGGVLQPNGRSPRYLACTILGFFHCR